MVHQPTTRQKRAYAEGEIAKVALPSKLRTCFRDSPSGFQVRIGALLVGFRFDLQNAPEGAED